MLNKAAIKPVHGAVVQPGTRPPEFFTIHKTSENAVSIKYGFNYSPTLSNFFWCASLRITTKEHTFGNVEGAYQFEKAIYFTAAFSNTKLYGLAALPNMDQALLLKHYENSIHGKVTGIEAKRAGSKKIFLQKVATATLPYVKGDVQRAQKLYAAVNQHWQNDNTNIMYELLKQKYSLENPDFLQLLLATGDLEIHEARSRGGGFWEKHYPLHGDPGMLGILLMRIRAEMRSVVEPFSDQPTLIELPTKLSKSKRKTNENPSQGTKRKVANQTE
jgi:hypothetical protein